MTLDDFEEYADENISNETESIGKTTLQLDSDVIDEIKGRVKVSTNKAVAPVVESILLDEVGREDDAQEKMDEFQENVA